MRKIADIKTGNKRYIYIWRQMVLRSYGSPTCGKMQSYRPEQSLDFANLFIALWQTSTESKIISAKLIVHSYVCFFYSLMRLNSKKFVMRNGLINWGYCQIFFQHLCMYHQKESAIQAALSFVLADA